MVTAATSSLIDDMAEIGKNNRVARAGTVFTSKDKQAFVESERRKVCKWLQNNSSINL